MWKPFDTAPKEPYQEILVAVPRYEEDGYVHRTAMWDQENDDWTVFMCNWGARPEWWMPLPDLPTFTSRAPAPAPSQP
jgi:hypothetical protein